MSDQEIKKTYGLIAHPLNTGLISELKEKGENVLVFPEIKPLPVNLDETAREIIKNPAAFDWLILTDVFAADFLIEALRETGTDYFELDNLTVCALGEAVADRLRFVQLHADVIPPRTGDEAVFAAIAQYAGDLKDQRFLVAREAAQTFPFVESLKIRHAGVQELAIYQAGADGESDWLRLKTLVQGGAVDEFIFSSAEDVISLKTFLGTAELASVLSEVKASAVNEIAFQTLQENGLRPLYFHQ